MRIAILATALLAVIPQQGRDDLRFTLARDSIISGVRCGPTGRARASAYRNGQLASCPVARDTVVGQARLIAGTWITLEETGKIRSLWLQRPTEIQGVPCRGDGYKTWATDLYPSGRLRRCFLSRAAEVDGVPCRSSWFWSELRGNTAVMMHENGRLSSCVLSRAFERHGTSFPKNRRIRLDAAGDIVKQTP